MDILKELEEINIGDTKIIPIPMALGLPKELTEHYIWEKKLYLTKLPDNKFSGKIETIMFDPIEQAFYSLEK